MALFEKFTDTIFLKSDSNLEKKIEVLKELKEKYPDNAQMPMGMPMGTDSFAVFY